MVTDTEQPSEGTPAPGPPHCMHLQSDPTQQKCCWCDFGQKLDARVAQSGAHGPHYGTPEYQHVWVPEAAGACPGRG